jgi:broad specificity phosphatase PhoE
MNELRRIVLVRHGETDGESSIRFHGANDVGLAESGRAHMRAVARFLSRERFDVVAASPLRRAWQSAWIVGRGAPVRFEPGFREVDFGRWEGLTRDEIARTDPVLYEDWQNGSEEFVFPGGEARADFRTRVLAGLDRLLASDARSALVVGHKGTIRVIARELTGADPAPEQLELGGVVELTRDGDAGWFLGRRSSDPPALAS